MKKRRADPSRDARKAALRTKLAARKQQARAQLAARKAAARARVPRRTGRRRRWWAWALLGLGLAALLLMRDCGCRTVRAVPSPTPRPIPSTPGATELIEDANISTPSPGPARVQHQPRGEYTPTAPAPTPWLDAFRLQVAARSPRLAACFVGAARPGVLRWTAAVEPSTGRVSEQVIETTLESDPLTRTQRACVEGVLGDPVYRLDGAPTRDTPVRVALTVEF